MKLIFSCSLRNISRYINNILFLIDHSLNESENDLSMKIDKPHFVPHFKKEKQTPKTLRYQKCVVKGYKIINIPIFTNEYTCYINDFVVDLLLSFACIISYQRFNRIIFIKQFL